MIASSPDGRSAHASDSAFTILLYTGLRRGDAAILGRQHVSDGVILMRAEKTDAQLTIPILPELARVIDATKTGDLTFIATATGAPMRKEFLRQLVSRGLRRRWRSRLRAWAPKGGRGSGGEQRRYRRAA